MMMMMPAMKKEYLYKQIKYIDDDDDARDEKRIFTN